MKPRTRIKKFQLIDLQIEKNKLQNEKDRLQISRDFSEITLVISLLAGIWVILWKIIDYFSNNTLENNYLQYLAYFFVYFLFTEFLFLFLFMILKGHAISTKTGNLRTITQSLLRYSFEYSIVFSSLIALKFIFDSNNKGLGQNPIYNILASAFGILIPILIIILINLDDFKKSKAIKPIQAGILMILIGGLILIFPNFFVSLLIFPSYFLTGSYSIESFPQSNLDEGFLTFTIKETGITYDITYITLQKLNFNDTSIFNDTIIINSTHANLSKSMFGKRYKSGIWYLTINTSTLPSGSYRLHAEVTNDISRNSTLGTITKYGDRLFYITSGNINYSSNFHIRNGSINITSNYDNPGYIAH